ncbi:TolB protein [Arboricoccus pini]|uniref:Tol-Pal system protein TolB n=1 Tax=Arboricoccus pini TaxID=1963835 RepID=A0A212QT29_9PROT|nr:Tol-Pal system beta propeller repeat protein TolB [Arboricoccus pini]SNB62778.1 TolB protein [Arboricoccus pini]
MAAGSALPFGSAHAQLQVEVNRGKVEPMPIAISPMAGSPMGTQIAGVITTDLAGSGLFRPIDQAAFIQSPQELADAAPRFPDWRQINAQALVTGRVQDNGGTIGVEFRLWDVYAGTQLTGMRYDATSAQWRRLAHKIADEIYRRLTGDAGYFDTRICYISETGPAKQKVKRLAIMDQDGANHAFLTDGNSLVLTPRFSPDTRQIAYMAYRGGRPTIYVRTIATGQEISLGDFGGTAFAPRFAPSSDSLLVTVAREGNSDIYRVDIGSRSLRPITSGSAIDTSPSYSPDGSRIVFVSDRGGIPQLYVMGSSGGGAQRISFGNGRYGDPAWSPRGDFIAFTNIQGGMFHVGLMRPDGSDERLITRSYRDQSPNWAPNGRVIVFSRQSGDRSRLFSIDSNGYNERQLPTPLDASDPDWSAVLP